MTITVRFTTGAINRVPIQVRTTHILSVFSKLYLHTYINTKFYLVLYFTSPVLWWCKCWLPSSFKFGTNNPFSNNFDTHRTHYNIYIPFRRDFPQKVWYFGLKWVWFWEKIPFLHLLKVGDIFADTVSQPLIFYLIFILIKNTCFG